MADPIAPGESFVVRLEGVDDAEDRDDLFRRLQRELSEEHAGLTAVSEQPPRGAKTDIGVISELVVPFVVASIPVVADKIHTWVSAQRIKCTVIVKLPDGKEIHIPNVKKEDVPEVVADFSGSPQIEFEEEA